jgi:hypothetical protein
MGSNWFLLCGVQVIPLVHYLGMVSFGFRLGGVQPIPIGSPMSGEKRQAVMSNTSNRKHFKLWSAASYRIEVEGYVDESWSDSLGGMRVTTRKREDQSTVTTLVGQVRDQAELRGVLNSLYELHLPVLSVEMLEEVNGAGEGGRDPDGSSPSGAEEEDNYK